MKKVKPLAMHIHCESHGAYLIITRVYNTHRTDYYNLRDTLYQNWKIEANKHLYHLYLHRES